MGALGWRDVLVSSNVNEAVKADDQSFDFAGWFEAARRRQVRN
jgi:hypothetical protein